MNAPFYELAEHFAIDLPRARAVFTTRRGGRSVGPYAELNLGILTDDDPEAVRDNREALARRLGVGLAWVRQVHGGDVRTVRRPLAAGETPDEADGLATDRPGVGLLALAADCLPIAIAGGGAAGIVHAGWPGLATGVVHRGVEAVRALGDGSPLEAAIGPGAGRCCYEVGDELRERFAAYGEAARNGANLDLKLIARRQLEEAGVSVIHDIGLCTICSEPELLFSHRRDGGLTGRQAGVVWLS